MYSVFVEKTYMIGGLKKSQQVYTFNCDADEIFNKAWNLAMTLGQGNRCPKILCKYTKGECNSLNPDDYETLVTN